MLSRNNKILVGCLALLLVLSVGYALFSDTITINGSATAKGSFDMAFTTASIKNEVGSTGATVNISADGNTLNITVPHLEYPGAYVDVAYNIKNNGTIPALYSGYSITGETDRIKTFFDISELYYEPNKESTDEIRIYWDEENNTSDEETTTISFAISYSQVADKNVACNNLTEMQTIIEECASYMRFDEECENNKNDLNNDGWIDGFELTLMDEIKRNTCSNN